MLAENGFLLLLGLAAGAVSALVAAAPHLVRQAAATPWLSLAGLLAATVAVGLAVGAIAAAGRCGRRWSRPCGVNKSSGTTV